MSAIFHRKVDGPISRQQQMLSTLQYVVIMMSMKASAWQEASKQAARHQGMQLVSVLYRPWLPPTDCCLLTWQ